LLRGYLKKKYPLFYAGQCNGDGVCYRCAVNKGRT